MPLQFHITPAARDLGLRGAFALLSGLDNTIPAARLQGWREALVARLAADLSAATLNEDPILAGFRDLHERIGRSNRRFPASAEALVALFLRKGVVPAINPVVDLYNGISLETRLSLGAHDADRIVGDVTLGLTDGGERFVPLGATVPETVGPGEYAYTDGTGEIVCRLEHRQCERTRVTAHTTRCFYILQGNARTPRGLLEAALENLVASTRNFCGGHLDAAWIAD